jgi:hypothetical protein
LSSIYLSIITGCKKISEGNTTESENITKQDSTSASYFSRDGSSLLPHTNEALLKLMRDGGGGSISVNYDSTCTNCNADSIVTFPSFIFPINESGMLSFASMADYEGFIKAAGLMEDLWTYSKIDYEDTPDEIYHLGEESLNSLDSLLGFSSLRHKYELNEYYNYDWADTASIYVDDEDYPTVLNTDYEVKIGTKYYKYLSNSILAIVHNGSIQTLDSLRVFGFFMPRSNVTLYNEEVQSYETPNEIFYGEGGCDNFVLYGFASNVTPQNPGTTQWNVRLNFSNFYNQSSTSQPSLAVLADYTINWGDGNIETFRDRYRSPAIKFHTYSQSIPVGGSVTKNISISCTVVNPQADCCLLLFHCPGIANEIFTASTNVTLSIPPDPGDCLDKNIKRKFYGAQLSVNGKAYRLYCKLKQKSDPQIGFSHVTATVIFEKQKTNGSWKKANSISTIGLNLRGKIYNDYSCDNVFGTLNNSEWRNKKKKLKIKDNNVTSSFRSRKSLPNAINADFIWTYNNGQTLVGVYNERLKP